MSTNKPVVTPCSTARLPHLSWFMAFKAVADRQSFTEASRDLHLTQPAISQQVAKLEALLKTKLFFRTSRTVSLTEEGKRLYDKIDMPINTLLNVVDEFHAHSDYYTLHIETEPVFSRQVVSQLLPQFLGRHPNLLVAQMLTTQHLDFLPQTELAIKWGESHWEGFDSQFLCGLDYVPVCSPEYLAKHPLNSLADLNKAVLIHDRDTTDWQYWLKYYPVPGLDLQKGHVASECNVVMSLAMSGLGVALCAYQQIQEHLADGTLVLPFPEHKVRHSRAYYILTRKNKPLSPEAVSFVQFMHEAMLSASQPGLYRDTID
ncbi:LysR family transcriptional regulator [Ferrimonas balearica]|uniref:LysR substrate-binding domain-containing protein n=1 Tax=Ferrimonas balearica TaxID=44012 RepID=UPI001C57816F|nr:LysR substrate-binding domain-containing protein [Ferrimonas balearica]MBW3140626.1 LysR family transcriptional regulator [Ferrimonas balearica]